MNLEDVKEIAIAEGDVRTIHDENNRLLWGRLCYETKYEGDTSQLAEPSPEHPQTINIVTGTQTITLTDGVISDDYTVNLGSIELGKIGTYQDYIYKSSDDWYVHKAVGKIVFDGSASETWTRAGTLTSGAYKMGYDDLSGLYVHPSISTDPIIGYCSHFEPKTETQLNNLATGFSGNTAGTKIFIYNPDHNTTATDFKTWLSSHNVTLYYALVTPTDTKITDTTLIEQLDDIEEWLTRYGYNATVAGNLPIIINQTDLQKGDSMPCGGKRKKSKR